MVIPLASFEKSLQVILVDLWLMRYCLLADDWEAIIRDYYGDSGVDLLSCYELSDVSNDDSGPEDGPCIHLTLHESTNEGNFKNDLKLLFEETNPYDMCTELLGCMTGKIKTEIECVRKISEESQENSETFDRYLSNLEILKNNLDERLQGERELCSVDRLPVSHPLLAGWAYLLLSHYRQDLEAILGEEKLQILSVIRSAENGRDLEDNLLALRDSLSSKNEKKLESLRENYAEFKPKVGRLYTVAVRLSEVWRAIKERSIDFYYNYRFDDSFVDKGEESSIQSSTPDECIQTPTKVSCKSTSGVGEARPHKRNPLMGFLLGETLAAKHLCKNEAMLARLVAKSDDVERNLGGLEYQASDYLNWSVSFFGSMNFARQVSARCERTAEVSTITDPATTALAVQRNEARESNKAILSKYLRDNQSPLNSSCRPEEVRGSEISGTIQITKKIH